MEARKKIILLGGGGHARVLSELIRMSGEYEIAGILDPQLESGSHVSGIPVLGDDELLPALAAGGINNACIAVGSIRDNGKRKYLYDLVKDLEFHVPSLIHPRALVSEAGTHISEGVQIMAGAIIQAGSTIGENTIINTGAIIEHDCTIGGNVHICPGAVVIGGSVIGENSFIGASATVIQGVTVGRNTVVGAGTVVLRDVADGTLLRGTVAG
ncbi:MAG: acetyltransferase [Deferribacteres bacterium]|nr:acetyltransferase [Deferribacteres bacterium]